MSKNNNKQKKKNNSPGFLLKKARESQNLSQDYIAGQLRLAIEVIDALESDSYDRLPAPIFVRGYLRSYTTILGISGGRVLECYNLLMGDDVHEVSLATVRMKDKPASSATSGVRKFLPFAAIGLLVLLGIILWLSSSDDVKPVEPVKVEEPAAKTDTALPDKPGTITLPVVSRPEQHMPEAEPQQQKPQEKPVKKPDPVTEAVKPKKIETEITKPVDVSGEESLVLVFTNSSWVDIRDSQGKRMIYNMVKPGSEHAVTGKPPFRITLGNAHGVILKRNGLPVDLTPYIRGNVARFSLGHAGN